MFEARRKSGGAGKKTLRIDKMNIVIFITASSEKEAVVIAKKLVAGRLAACVNVLNGVKSFFRWEGKIDSAKEVLLIVKSHKSKFNKILKAVKSSHSYLVPEIIALPIIEGDKKYIRWLNDSIR